jgi:hypothetical protein
VLRDAARHQQVLVAVREQKSVPLLPQAWRQGADEEDRAEEQ